MKKQFLSDSGLTELIGYIKTYITSKITWGNVTGKPTTFPPENHSHDDRYFTETEINTKLAGKANSSHKHTKAEITDFPISMPASDVPTWAKQASKPAYTKSEVGLGSVDNTADKDKEVKYASSSGSAGTAASVPWSGVTGKPSAYPPEGHTHDDRYYTESEVDSKLSGKSNTTHNHDDRYYTESEMDTKLSGKSDSGHSHNYAGSNSIGGAANSANKLNNLGRIRSADDLDNFIEGSVFKYGTVADIDGLDGLVKNDGIILCAPWESDSYGHQIFLDDNGYTIAHRFRANGTWSTWKTLIDTSNISSQSVNYATTASSCSGNAATATNASKVNNHTVNSDVPSNAKFTDTVYSHPTYTAKSSGLYKVTVDDKGHVSAIAAVTKSDITGLGIPGSDTNTWRPLGTSADTACAGNDSRLSNARPANGGNASTVNEHTVNADVPENAKFTDTTYSAATTSAAGLMSANDKTNLTNVINAQSSSYFTQDEINALFS
nr:MAG TPA: structural protein [Caudoviricetes sp.]